MNGDGLLDEVNEDDVVIERKQQENTGTYTVASDKPKVRKKRKSPMYVLEKYKNMLEAIAMPDVGSDEKANEIPMWVQVADGFKSADAAMKHVEKEKMEGVFRSVRVVSGPYAANLITPEPVFTMEKLNPKGLQ